MLSRIHPVSPRFMALIFIARWHQHLPRLADFHRNLHYDPEKARKSTQHQHGPPQEFDFTALLAPMAQPLQKTKPRNATPKRPKIESIVPMRMKAKHQTSQQTPLNETVQNTHTHTKFGSFHSHTSSPGCLLRWRWPSTRRSSRWDRCGTAGSRGVRPTP